MLAHLTVGGVARYTDEHTAAVADAVANAAFANLRLVIHVRVDAVRAKSPAASKALQLIVLALALLAAAFSLFFSFLLAAAFTRCFSSFSSRCFLS